MTLNIPMMDELLSDHTARRLRQLVAHAQRDCRLPSLVVAVGKHGRILDSVLLGSADITTATAPGLDVQYRVGSITKTFTAVGVMQLVAEGRIGLSDPIGRHWIDAPHPDLTIASLLTHTSGLQRESAAEPGSSGALPSREELPGNAAAARLLYPSGYWWHYSNLGFALLGEVMAQICGQSWESRVTERILRPLGLERTTAFPQVPAAQGYSVRPFSDEIVAELPGDSGALAPAGQLWSTAADLTRWIHFLIRGNPEILPSTHLELMRAPRVIADLEHWTTAFGLGLVLRRQGERVFVGHIGAMPGFLAALLGSTASGNSVVLFTNSTAGIDIGQLAADILELVEADSVDLTPWQPADQPPAEYESVLGRWWSEWSEFLFRWRDGELQSMAADAPAGTAPNRFRQVRQDVFVTTSGAERGEELQLVRDASGLVVKMYHATYPLTRATPQNDGTD
ncbi:MAG TPA: serine hydrolase domain-containing protein [Candidatus Saccharimonadales bacterium]|nr:serine hydrolase domain-containing protein [Candidatus Saccharimonadales bacterium]